MKKDFRVIQSIQRAIDIINCFDDTKYKLSLPEISEQLSLNINTTRGIVNTLLYNGFLEHDVEENKYSLGLVFIPKADFISSHSVDRTRDIVRPYLKIIAEKYQVSSRLQLISNFNIFTVETINPENSRYILLTRLNTPFPLYATSSGKLYLYYLDDKTKENYLDTISYTKFTDKTITNKEELKKELDFIKVQGYSCEFEEVGIGISSLAVPLLNEKNKLIGTISITASTPIIESICEDAIKDIKKIVKDIKDELIF